MKKTEMQEKIISKGGNYKKSWSKPQLKSKLSELMMNLSVNINTEYANPGGNWHTAKDWMPTIEIDQGKLAINITVYQTTGYQKKASVSTSDLVFLHSTDGSQVIFRCEIDCRNFKNGKCSGSQKFVFAIFIGDSGHIYTHRAPATKGWINCDPDNIRKRLRKLGIGISDCIQQGDFLLKPANRNAHSDSDFRHERMGSGHHNFEFPVLYHYGQYLILEPTKLIHTAIDGIKHPDVIVEPGKYIVGTTANQLNHSNARD